jgi:hypothetical protein
MKLDRAETVCIEGQSLEPFNSNIVPLSVAIMIVTMVEACGVDCSFHEKPSANNT